MTIKTNDQNRPDHDSNLNANDNHKPARGQVAAAATGSTALTSLEALGTVLNNVDTTSVVGGSGLPMLQFKRDGDGTWMYGQRRTVVEDGSRWAVNPTTFKWGFICFSNDNKVLAERLVPVSLPKPEIAELPDKGFEWHEQWAVNLKCIDGTDAGTEVVYKPTTVGGVQAVAGLIETVRDRLNGNQHDGKVSPIVLPGERLLPAQPVRSRLDAADDGRRLDVAERSGAGTHAGVAVRRSRPRSRGAGGSGDDRS